MASPGGQRNRSIAENGDDCDLAQVDLPPRLGRVLPRRHNRSGTGKADRETNRNLAGFWEQAMDALRA
jgi:hypothetical protein